MILQKHQEGVIWIQPRKAQQGESGALSRFLKIGLRREIRQRPLWLKYEQSAENFAKIDLDKVQSEYIHFIQVWYIWETSKLTKY